MKILDQLKINLLLSLLFAISLICTALFPFISKKFGFEFLDAFYYPLEVTNIINSMSAEMLRMHTIATLTLDVIYPLAYGLFFVGLVSRLSSNKKLILIPLILIFVDLAEGINQVVLLNLLITDTLLLLKASLTLIKFALLIISILMVTTLLFKQKNKRSNF